MKTLLLIAIFGLPLALTCLHAHPQNTNTAQALAVAQAATPPSSPAQKLIQPDEILKPFNAGGQRTRVMVLLANEAEARNVDRGSRAAPEQVRAAVKEREEQLLARLPAGEYSLRHRFENFAGFSAEVTLNALGQLLNDPDVLSIEPVDELHLHLAQGIPLMNGMLYRSTYNGAGVAVAVVDTGVDYTHPRLGGGNFRTPTSKVLDGYNFGDNNNDPMPNGQGHGTSCAGIVAGDVGTVVDYIGGVAPAAKLYALKVTVGNGETVSDDRIAAAWDWCVTHRNDNSNYPILVISTSIGDGRHYSFCDGSKPTLATAANNAVAAGITLLASTGNNGYCDSICSPACLSGVIAVGAVYDDGPDQKEFCISSASCAPGKVLNIFGCPDTWWSVTDVFVADQVTSYSNTSTNVAVLAPSHNCYTTSIVGSGNDPSGNYETDFGGTSAACPYAAGAVACLQSAAKARLGRFLAPDEVRGKLMRTGDNITDTKADITLPRVNLGRAIEAETFTWTGGAGDANWYNPTNWSPRQVPFPIDTVNVNAYNISMNPPVTHNGLFKWFGGLHLGYPSGVLTLGNNAVLVVSGGNPKYLYGMVTNKGSIVLGNDNTGFYIGDANSRLVNQGVIDSQGDNAISTWTGGGVLDNLGVFRKSGGSGTTSLSGSMYFFNHGTVETLSGTLLIGGNSTGEGQVWAGAGAKVLYDSYTASDGSLLTGPGRHEVSNGTLTIDGRVQVSNLVKSGALGNLYGRGAVVEGNVLWTGGHIGLYDGRLTLATNAVLVASGAGNKWLYGMVTNRGTIILSNDNARFYIGDANSRLVNQGVIDSQGDNTISNWTAGGVLDSFGVIRKSGGSSTTSVGGSMCFSNHGTVETLSGTLLISGNAAGEGQVWAGAGATVLYDSYTASDGSLLTGPGRHEVSNGTLTINGRVQVSNLVKSGALGNLYVNGGVIEGNVLWTGGHIGLYDGRLTLATNAVLVASGAGNKWLYGMVTNRGTIILSNDNARFYIGDANSRLVNQGVIDSQGDNTISNWTAGGVLDSFGVIRKSGGSSTTSVGGSMYFFNHGTVETLSGTLLIGGNSTGEGQVWAGAGAKVLYDSYTASDGSLLAGPGRHEVSNGTLTINGRAQGNLVKSGAFGNLYGRGAVVEGNVLWTGGYIGYPDGWLTLASNAVLVASGGGNKWLYGMVTNRGTIILSNDNAGFYMGDANSRLVNQGVIDSEGDNAISHWSAGGVIDNSGVIRKSGGTSTTSVRGSMSFLNHGSVEALCETMSFACPFDNSAGEALGVKITGPTSYGRITFSQPVVLRGAFRLTVAGGYRPSLGDSFPVITYPSQSGTFSSISGAVLGGLTLTPGYGANAFTLSAITDPRAVLASCMTFPNGTFQFQVLGATGQHYVIEASTNLFNWSATSTNVTGGQFLFSDPEPAGIPSRFYRARSQ